MGLQLNLKTFLNQEIFNFKLVHHGKLTNKILAHGIINLKILNSKTTNLTEPKE